MVFFGLNLMKAGFSPLKELPQFTALMGTFGAAGFGNLILSVLVGTVLTMVVQSSSAMLGVTIAMASVGLLTFDAAAALVLGENIGTTVTAQLAAINATADGRRAAMFHTLVNVLGVSVMLILFPFWISAVDAITPGDPLLTDPTGTRPNITAHIAVAHTSFNVIMVLVVLPFMKAILRLVNLLVSPLGKEHTSLKFLHTSMVGSPALAIEQGRQEVFQMADLTAEILHLTRDLYRDMTNTQSGIRDRILRKEKITDTIQHEITIFMSRVMAGVLTMAQTEEVRCLIRVADEIESVADYCERLANYRSRLLREGMSLTGAGLKDIQEYLRVTIAFYEEVIDRAKRGETGWLLAIQTKQGRLAEVANDLRDSHLHRLATQECQPTAGIFFNDMLVAMRRIRNHSYNIAEAFLGQK
jgi:phosphate:Na+ symporter